jgi:hypothetical protein
MAEKKTQAVEDLLTMYKTLVFDLPLATVQRGLRTGSEKETTEAAWKGYDAAVRLATTTIDSLYRLPMFGDVIARSLEGMLRIQQVNNALAGAFFTGLWQTVGLPTAAETQALRAEVQALREELRSQHIDRLVKPKKKIFTPHDERHDTVAKARSHSTVSTMRTAA